MPAPLALRLTLYLMVLNGLAALHLADFLALPLAGLLGALVVATWWAGDLPGDLRRILDTVLVPLAAAGSLLDLAFLAETVLDALVRLLLFLVVYKLLTSRAVRDTRAVAFLVFFMLVAAASSAFGVGFLFVFLAFVVLATWVIVLQHVLLEAEAGGAASPAASPGGRGWSLRALIGTATVAAVGVITLTSGFFFVLPRVGLAALPLRARLGAMVTGFSDRVDLATFGAISTDDAVVMRVHLPDGPPAGSDPGALAGLRWRGLALDRFDGQAWTVRHPRRIRVVRTWGGELALDDPRGSRPALRQEVHLEPIGAGVVFAAPRLLRLRGLTGPIGVDDMLAVTISPPVGRLSYVVESEVEPGTPVGDASEDGPPAGPLDPVSRQRYLELPPLPARVPALARQVAGDGRDPGEAANRLVAFLSREFRYTLRIDRLTTLDPLEEFLLVRRTGHCEYFAGSLAVMLRTLGIPARVVNGFQRGEWNPYGRYFIVRRRDAHSWVEAYFDPVGWVTLDPSPRAAAEDWGPPGSAFLVLDALRLRWYRYVINWSFRDQASAVDAVRRRATTWGPWLASLRRWAGESRAPWLAVVAVVAAGALGYWWRERPDRPAWRGRGPIPGFYARALRRLARRGVRPGPSETARELCHRVGRLRPDLAEPFARVTEAYERARFGGAPPPPAERRQIEACVAALGGASRR